MKERVGIVLQSTGIDPYLTVAETVDLYSGYYPSPRPADEVIEVVGLTAKADTRVIKLSGGQQRRLDVAIALAGDPELLFLDEPTTGFDPSARRGAWEIVKNLAALGKTVLLTTHYMDEAQYLADRVAVIAAGSIVAEGPPSTIAGRDQAKTRIRFMLPDGVDARRRSTAPRSAPPRRRRRAGRRPTPRESLHELTGWAIDHGVDADRPRGPAPVARGRVPGADRRPDHRGGAGARAGGRGRRRRR